MAKPPDLTSAGGSDAPHRELPIKLNRLVVALGLVAYSAALVVVARRWDLPSIGVRAALLISLAVVIEFAAKGLFGILFRVGLARQGHAVTLRSSIEAALVGTAVARLVPGGSALSPSAMAWAVRSEDNQAAGAALRTTITSYGGLLVLSGIAVGWGALTGVRSADSVVTGVTATGLTVVGSLVLVASRWLGSVVRAMPSRLRRHFGPTADGGPIVLRELRLIMGRLALEAAALWLVLTAFEIDLTAGQTMLTFGTARVIAAVPITPGGIGLVEGGMLGVLAAIGYSTENVLAPVLVYQIVDYWFVAGVGLYAAGRLSRKRAADR